MYFTYILVLQLESNAMEVDEAEAELPTRFETLQVSSKNIRFIHLGANINVAKAVHYRVRLKRAL
jgi:hypothetical protein